MRMIQAKRQRPGISLRWFGHRLRLCEPRVFETVAIETPVDCPDRTDEELAEMAVDPEATLPHRLRAIECIVERQGPTPGRSALVRLMDEEAPLCAAAAFALARLNDPAGLSRLLDLVRAPPSPSLRVEAAVALKNRFDRDEGLAALAPDLESPERDRFLMAWGVFERVDGDRRERGYSARIGEALRRQPVARHVAALFALTNGAAPSGTLSGALAAYLGDRRRTREMGSNRRARIEELAAHALGRLLGLQASIEGLDRASLPRSRSVRRRLVDQVQNAASGVGEL